VTDATVVVEVLSPSTRASDAGAKLEDCVRLTSLRHYLLVKTDTRVITPNGRATAVLQDVESFEPQRQPLALFKLLSQGRIRCRSEPHGEP
jgi:Uma2 family endonuclease